MAEVLIDTNILIYAHQPEDVRYVQATRAIETLINLGRGRLSTQILGEFFSATTRGRRPILSPRQALAQMVWLADAVPVFDVTRLIVLEAARGVREHRLNYYDAQIWATARLNQVPTIFTEDFTDGRQVEGVRFINPLSSGFDIERWT